MQVKEFYLVVIMQSSSFNSSACKENRLQIGNRSNCTGTSYLEIN